MRGLRSNEALPLMSTSFIAPAFLWLIHGFSDVNMETLFSYISPSDVFHLDICLMILCGIFHFNIMGFLTEPVILIGPDPIGIYDWPSLFGLHCSLERYS